MSTVTSSARAPRARLALAVLLAAGGLGLSACSSSSIPAIDMIIADAPPDLPALLDLPVGMPDRPNQPDVPVADVPPGEDLPVPTDTVGQDLVGQDTVGQDLVGQDTVGQDTVGQDTPGMDLPGIDMVDSGPGADAITGSGTPIQDVQDGTVVRGTSVTLVKKFVTGVKVNSGGATNLYVQEPQGQTTAGHPYPEFSGVNVFFTGTERPNFADLTGLVVGDCISVTGTVDEFPFNASADVGTTQIKTPTAFVKETGCGTAPTPAPVAFADVATSNNTPGPKAEAYEAVLVVLSNVAVTGGGAVSSGRFNVSPAGAAGATVEIDSFLIGSNFSFPASTAFTSITGVYSQLNRGTGQATVIYRITPRTTDELDTQ